MENEPLSTNGPSGGRLAYERAIRRSDLPPPSRHLALTIATWADIDTGVIPERFQPSMNTLLAATGMSKGSMLNHLGRLENEGWITCDRPSEHDARTRHIRNSYGLAIPGGLGQEPTQPRSGADPALGQEIDQGRVRSRPRARSGADPKSPCQSLEVPPPYPPQPEPAAAVVPRQGVGEEPSTADDPAAAFVDSLPYRGQVPNRSTRERLLTRVRDAFTAGWTVQALHRQLTNDTANAQSVTGLYLHRLAQLPDARTAASAATAEETYTPPKYQAQPTPDAVPPNQAHTAARAAIRAQTTEHQHGRDRRPYVPARGRPSKPHPK